MLTQTIFIVPAYSLPYCDNCDRFYDIFCDCDLLNIIFDEPTPEPKPTRKQRRRFRIVNALNRVPVTSKLCRDCGRSFPVTKPGSWCDRCDDDLPF